MADDETIHLVGGTGSPYTQKLEEKDQKVTEYDSMRSTARTIIEHSRNLKALARKVAKDNHYEFR
jgi:hypothetical protein